MTEILSPLKLEYIDNRYIRLTVPFGFHSDALKCDVHVPKGFVCDLESVPVIRGTCPRGGVAHDYVCRKDSVPVCTKAQAAAVYREITGFLYAERSESVKDRAWGWIRKWAKWSVVAVAPGYFHKLPVMASYEEVEAA